MLTKAEFEQVFDQHFDDVAAFLHSYASDKEQLKDWVQEVFIKLWEARNHIDFNHPGFKSYLFTTARNHALKKLQKQKKYDKWLEQNLKKLTEVQNRDDPAVNQPIIETKYKAALDNIPSRARKAYLLSREEGLTYQEIAEVMNISIKTVEAHIGKALRMLRTSLKKSSQ